MAPSPTTAAHCPALDRPRSTALIAHPAGSATAACENESALGLGKSPHPCAGVTTATYSAKPPPASASGRFSTQKLGLPSRQLVHRPQKFPKQNTAASPTANVETSAPTPAISPEYSCPPMKRGNGPFQCR